MLKFLMLTVAAAGLLLMMSVSDVSAQGRGHGQGNWGKKCEKFVNCHDARDGRWDNRGPRRTSGLQSSYYSRSRYYSPNSHSRWYVRHRIRHAYGHQYYVRSRRH